MATFKGLMHTYLGGMFLIASGSSKKEQRVLLNRRILERADYQRQVQQPKWRNCGAILSPGDQLLLYFRAFHLETSAADLHQYNLQNRAWNNGLVPNWERITSRLYMSPCLFNLYAEYIMQNARLNEAHSQSYDFSHSHIQMWDCKEGP